jgi:diguanylate cyclase (GGDEF)-like protein
MGTEPTIPVLDPPVAGVAIPSGKDMPDTSPTRTVLACLDSGDLASAAQVLSEKGLRLRPASEWSEALNVFAELRPAAVLLDSSFLEGAGAQLCGALRRSAGRLETPVLVLCGSRHDVDRAIEAGASDIVERPLNWKVVGRRLEVLARAFLATSELESSRRKVGEAQRKVAEAWRRIEEAGRIDGLTGLPNRGHLERLLERTLLSTGPVQGSLAVLVLDIDRFTELNETLGRRGGDAILRWVAGRLGECMRRRPLDGGVSPGVMAAARLSGDEFTLVLTEATGGGSVEAFARSVQDALSVGFEVGGSQVYLSLSIGIAVASGADTDAGTLLQHAETAGYAAKRRGGGQYCFYDAELASETEARLDVDRRLRRALDKGELELHYQPLIEAGSRRVRGLEALLRWNDPERGTILPAEFIGIAESTGLMPAIGSWVLSTACRQLRAWMDGGLPPTRIAVNVSRCQLEREGFAAEVEQALADNGIDPGLLELELSERSALRTDPGILAQIRRLKGHGVRLVVDNFGTGQSSLAHLRQFSLDGLKIDRSFIRGVTRDGDSATVTAALTDLAHRFSLTVVAEGVETEAELAKVRELGCETVQGYLLSRPCSADEMRGRVMHEHGSIRLLEVSVSDAGDSRAAASAAEV